MRQLDTYGIRNIYKGKFLKYVDDNYVTNDNYDAYIEIPDLIIGQSGTDELIESIEKGAINNINNLNLEPSVTSIRSIKCKPLYINKIIPILSNGEEVFVVIFDNDPKKIFYINIQTLLPNADEKAYKFVLRIGHSVIFIDRDEIRVYHDLDDPDEDNGITISEFGIEVNSKNIIINGVNFGDLIDTVSTLSENYNSNVDLIESRNTYMENGFKVQTGPIPNRIDTSKLVTSDKKVGKKDDL
mgnify:CR=1 FL=1